MRLAAASSCLLLLVLAPGGVAAFQWNPLRRPPAVGGNLGGLSKGGERIHPQRQQPRLFRGLDARNDGPRRGVGGFSAADEAVAEEVSAAINAKKRRKYYDGRSDKMNGKGGRRMKKSEIDHLVRGIGLKPAPNSSSSKYKKVPILNTPSNPQPQRIGGDADIRHIIQRLPKPVISLQTQLDFSRLGHAVLRSFLPRNVVERLRSELVRVAAARTLPAWRQKVEVALADSPDDYFRNNARVIAENLNSVEECRDLLESLGMDWSGGDIPFLQHFNTWRTSEAPSSNDGSSDASAPAVRELCFSPHLARTASLLLDAPTIRLYQDSLFHKRAGDGWTPWHSDARMAPFDTSRMITFWVALQPVPAPEDGGTGLVFADGSHSDFALPYWNGVDGDEHGRLESRYGVSHHMPLEAGDVTVHSGWTLHCADAADNEGGRGEDRYALSITYVDGEAELRENVLSTEDRHSDDIIDDHLKGHNEDAWSYRSWAKDVEPRQKFRHPAVPFVWPRNKRSNGLL